MNFAFIYACNFKYSAFPSHHAKGVSSMNYDLSEKMGRNIVQIDFIDVILKDNSLGISCSVPFKVQTSPLVSLPILLFLFSCTVFDK